MDWQRNVIKKGHGCQVICQVIIALADNSELFVGLDDFDLDA